MKFILDRTKKSLGVFFIAGLLLVSQSSSAAIYSKSEFNFGAVPVFGQLGSGYIDDRQFFTLTNCLNGTESFEGAPVGSVTFRAVKTYEELKSNLKLTANGSVNLKFFDFGASSEFAMDSQSSSYSLVAVYKLNYTLKNEAFNPTAPVLNGIGERASQDPNSFIEICGSKFVSQRQIGGELYVSVKLNFQTIDAKKTFESSAKVALGNIVSLGGSFTSNSSLYRDVLGIEIFAHQLGGDPSALGGIFQDASGDFPAIHCSKSNLTACQNAITAVVNYGANRIPDQIRNPSPGAGPAILDYAFRDYRNVGVLVQLPKSEVTPEILAAREQLAKELEIQSNDLNRASQLATESGPEVHASFSAEIQAILGALRQNVKGLRGAGVVCFEQPVICVTTAQNALLALQSYNRNTLLSGPRIPLHRYWHSGIRDHFYTTNFSELGGGRSGWAYEGKQGFVLRYNPPGTVPLYRYWNGSDHFYTTNWFELGGGSQGYTYEGVEAYVYPSKIGGTAPLYRYWGNSDHFYTTNFGELGNGRGGYRYEGIQAYIFSSHY